MSISDLLRKKGQGTELQLPHLITDENAPFSFRESFNLLGVNLRYSFGDTSSRKVTITSVTPASGKSIVSINLGIALAGMGDRVVLVDMDLRKAMVNSYLKLEKSVGLTEMICSDVLLENALQPSGVENLDVIVSGTLPPNPMKLLLSEKLKIILDDLSGRYDWVIVDTPPLGLVSDALVISKETDGLALIVDKQKDLKKSIQKSLDAINQTNVNFLGVILNKTEESHKKYYGKEYAHSEG